MGLEGVASSLGGRLTGTIHFFFFFFLHKFLPRGLTFMIGKIELFETRCGGGGRTWNRQCRMVVHLPDERLLQPSREAHPHPAPSPLGLGVLCKEEALRSSCVAQ